MVAESEKTASPEAPPPAPPGSHRTEPDHNEKGWPKGVPFIIGNEGCERFSYYGMRAILVAYMTFLFQQTGLAEGPAEDSAYAVYHYFAAAVYFFPILGAIVADRLFGKYKTILWLSMVYTAGHLVLSLGEGSIPGTYAGLVLIAIGSGGIKPCVSAHVGDQFGRGNRHLLGKMYQAFYFIINFGSLFSQLMIPWLKNTFGWSVAFALPGVLMAIATLFFWLGRHRFIHVPPSPGGRLGVLDVAIGACLCVILGGPWFTDTVGVTNMLYAIGVALVILPFVYTARQRIEQDDGFFATLFTTIGSFFTGAHGKARSEGFGKKLPSIFAAAEKKLGYDAVEAHVALWRIMSIFVFVIMFWALFDQHASTWVVQAKEMNRDLFLFTFDESQIQFLNPALVMILIPTNMWIFRLLEKSGVAVTMLNRMTVGMLLTGASFVSAALVQQMIDQAGDGQVWVLWQFPQYLIITQAEVLVSITGLEFAYTQSPKRVKSTVMGLWLLSIFLGNAIVGKVVTSLAKSGDGAIDKAAFFWGFAIAMGVFGVLFALRARVYKTREYVQ